MPLRAILTSGTVADCPVAPNLLKKLTADYLLADRGYASNSIIKQAEEQGMQPVIPPRKHRKHYRKFDSDLYKNRHVVECVFAKIKQWRGIATRFAKRASSFLASIQIRFIAIWAEIL